MGETNQTAKQRVREHKCHTKTGHTELSAIAEHGHNEGHIFWQPRVIVKETDTTKRKIKEALQIHRIGRQKKKTMNPDCGLQLSRLWLEVL